jgi:hypothetical protein
MTECTLDRPARAQRLGPIEVSTNVDHPDPLASALTFLRAARFRPNLAPEAAMHREIVNDRLKLMYHRLVVRRLAHDSSLMSLTNDMTGPGST